MSATVTTQGPYGRGSRYAYVITEEGQPTYVSEYRYGTAEAAQRVGEADAAISSGATIWQYGVEGGYHDTACRCPRHCGNCYDDLPAMVARGALGPRERYCSGYCRNRAKRERALDRLLSSS